MIFGNSNFIGVESQSDFISPQFVGGVQNNDPCNPRICMFIDDNITPRVAGASDVRVIKHIKFKKCKKHRHHHDCGDVSPDISQFHVHEVQGSTEIAEENEDPHDHRFATVSGEARFIGNNHVHDVWFRTDFYEGHYHEAWGTTGFAIQVGDRHVHFLEGVTTVDDGHSHNFRVGTLIEDPIGD